MSISKQKSAASGSSSIKTQKQMSKQESAASSSETYDLQKENAYLWGRINELNQQLNNANGELHDLWLDRRKGKNLVRDSKDEMEVNEEKARAKMKMILKTFPIELELKYDEKFTSKLNDEILQQVIPQLIEAMKPRYTSRYRQKKARRIKGAKSLFDKNDEKLENYDRKELLNILNAPNWTYVEQNTPADTDFSELETPIQTEENLIMVEDVEVSAEIDEIAVIKDLEPTGMEESELTGMEESPEMEDETDKWYKFIL
ncbi:hypothetical protein C1646_749495 [Rhizophagus diaphanus]|nr:hypothetical protein C1646_749495 [Rhizophagus diaphanus] [Rhizophagus sp. MUCL 43196]